MTLLTVGTISSLPKWWELLFVGELLRVTVTTTGTETYEPVFVFTVNCSRNYSEYISRRNSYNDQIFYVTNSEVKRCGLGISLQRRFTHFKALKAKTMVCQVVWILKRC